MLEYKISFILPVYNGSKYIDKCIKSILNQTYKNLELICVNDGSTDDSLDKLNEYSKKDSRVIVINQKNCGTSIARKNGVIHSTGDYIMFADQDDWFSNKNACKLLCEEIISTKADVIQFGYYNLYNHIRIPKHNNKKLDIDRNEFMENYFADLLGNYIISITPTVWNKIYRGDILRESECNVKEVFKMPEDLYLNILFFSNQEVKKISIIDKVLYTHVAQGGYSSTIDYKIFEEYTRLKKVQVDTIKNFNLNESVLFQCHLEIIYFMKSLVLDLIENKNLDSSSIEEVVKNLNTYGCVKDAKEYFGQKQEDIWDELSILITQDEDEYLNYLYMCKTKQYKSVQLKNKLKEIVKKI